MCSQKWDKIKYENVASICMYKNRNVFMKHDQTGFENYLNLLTTGDQKINASQLFPHELVKYYIKTLNIADKTDEVIEAQWKKLIKHCKQNEKISLSKCLAVCDVSGSMLDVSNKSQIPPINVCVGLGLLMAEITDKPFGKQLITFNSCPQFCSINGVTLQDRVKQVCQMPWGMNTNIEGVFDLILDKCRKFNLTPDQCPETIFVFSDMQFDKCITNSHGHELTNYQAIKHKYEQAGYLRPNLVFWNLNNEKISSSPVTSTENRVAMVSGFSPSLMKLFLKGQDITSYGIMKQAIEDKRYEQITLTRTKQTNLSKNFYAQ